MAPPKLPKFPSLAERRSLMAQLLEAEQNGTALTNNEHYRAYAEKLKALNEKMDGYSVIDEEFGLPPTLDEAGKLDLMNAMRETALLGETFLADVTNKNGNLNAGIPSVVGNLQGMLGRDFGLLQDYDPTKTPLSFPELQQNARTRIVDLRGKKLGVMRNKLSFRLPMTVVDEHGNRRPGVFTKASYVDLKSKFNGMLTKAASYYDSDEFKSSIVPYRRALFRDQKITGYASEDQIPDDAVIAKMKEKVTGILPRYRDQMIQTGTKVNGKAPENASDEEMILSLIMNFERFTYLRARAHANVDKTRLHAALEFDADAIAKAEAKAAEEARELTKLQQTMNAVELDLDTLPEEAADELKAGFSELFQDRTNLVNVRDLGLQEGQRFDHRNSAMTAVATLMGMNHMVAKSENMKFLDENGEEVEGTFMEFADGLDLHGKNGLKEFNKVSDDPFAPPCDALEQIADLQAFDYLCGNADRHGGNMSYYVDENGKFTGIKAFDNDTSFGVIPIDKKKGLFRQAGLNDLKVITEPMAKKIAAMTPEMLKFTLRGRGLTEEEIQAGCQRLTELQGAIREAKQAKTIDDVKAADREHKLSIMKPEDLKNIHINELPDTKYALFHNVRVQLHNRMQEAREAGYQFVHGALEQEKNKTPNLTEVSTTERVYAAGGIADSMSAMDRALKNEVTGFQVGGLSRFLHSSGKWRSMISAVKDATKAAKAINKAIGKDKEYLTRDDPKVRQQLEKANRAMEKVRKANEEYLQRKMREKHVNTPEELVGRGKHDYEQKRIDYALKLRKSIHAYRELQDPQNQKAQEKQAAVTESLEFANKRRAQQEAQPQPQAHP